MTRTVSASVQIFRSFLNYLVNEAAILKSFSFPAFSSSTSDFFNSIRGTKRFSKIRARGTYHRICQRGAPLLFSFLHQLVQEHQLRISFRCLPFLFLNLLSFKLVLFGKLIIITLRGTWQRQVKPTQGLNNSHITESLKIHIMNCNRDTSCSMRRRSPLMIPRVANA